MKRCLLFIGFLTAVLTFTAWHSVAEAVDTTPQQIVYNGHLLDSSNNPITTSHSLRFSLWRSADFITGDVTVAGAINTGAANYLGWFEVHTLTPDANGFFTVNLGSITTLPKFDTFSVADLQSMFIQVEVKAAAAADTAYELMDVNPSSATIDRSPVNSVPFAFNADFIDQREIGTGSGDIAILNEDGVFDTSAIPGGTNSGAFVIDFNNDDSGSEMRLVFGNALQKYLAYNPTSTQFFFNDDLRVEGNLTVTGLINGIDISTLASADSHLKVSSGGGLTIDVGAGSYRLNGVVTNYTGTSGVTIANNTTSYVFFTGTGLTVNTSGFPTNLSSIQLAEVTTSAGVVQTIADRRILQADDREHDLSMVIHPGYEGTSFTASGSTAVGQLKIDHDTTNRRNFYKWTSTRSALNDYVLNVPFRITSDFLRWNDPALRLDYRTSTGGVVDNKIEVTAVDTAGVAITLSGSTTNLSGTGWTTTNIEFTGSPTYTAGEDIMVRIQVFARNNFEAHVGNLEFRTRELEPQ